MTRDTYDMFEQKDRGRFGENEERQHRPGRGPRVTGASDLHDFKLVLRREKPAAIAVSDPTKSESIWLPKSQIEWDHTSGGLVVVTMPEWLAREKGLI